MTIDEMKTRTALYDFLELAQAALNKDYLVRKDPAMNPLQERVQAMVNDMTQLLEDLNNGAIN